MRYAFAILAALAACSLPTEPAGARRIDPPAEYRALWEEVAACVGRYPSFDAVSWYSVEPVTSDGWRGFECAEVEAGCLGLRRGNSIYLSEPWLGDEALVKHEILHVIVNDNGHPAPPFGTCAPEGWE